MAHPSNNDGADRRRIASPVWQEQRLMATQFPNWNPEEWHRRVITRDPEAWQAIYTTCVWVCDTYPERWSQTEREWAAEQAFIQVIEKLLAGQQVYRIRGFVVKVAQNICNEQFRRQKDVQEQPLPISTEDGKELVAPPPPTVLPSPDKPPPHPEYRSLIEALKTCISKLNDLERQLVALIGQGVKRSELAGLLQESMTINAINVRYHRMLRNKLRPCLQHSGYSSDRIIRVVRLKGESHE